MAYGIGTLKKAVIHFQEKTQKELPAPTPATERGPIFKGGILKDLKRRRRRDRIDEWGELKWFPHYQR